MLLRECLFYQGVWPAAVAREAHPRGCLRDMVFSCQWLEKA